MLAVLVVGLALTVRRDREVRLAAVVLAVMVIFTFGDAHPLGIPCRGTGSDELPVLRSVLPGRFSFASWLVDRLADRALAGPAASPVSLPARRAVPVRGRAGVSARRSSARR